MLQSCREDRQTDGDDEQVADVDVGEGRRQEAPPVALIGNDQPAEGRERLTGRLLNQQQ